MSDVNNIKVQGGWGGKDAALYPVDRPTYDQTIQYMKEYVSKAKLSWTDKQKIFKRLN